MGTELFGLEFLRSGRCFGSKSGYWAAHPNHQVIFNANLVTRSKGKIWHGDLDLSIEPDRNMLQRLADAAGEPVHVLREMDCRFDTEASPLLENAVAIFHPTPTPAAS